jgi:cytidylate kinase
MIVTVSGEIGAGKSTVARTLAQTIGLRYLSAGDVFREEARRRGLSVEALGRLAEQNPGIDRELDRLQTEAARSGEILIESRLSGWLIDGDLRIWLRAPLAVRAARVAARDAIPEADAWREIQAREASERRRYRELYRIDVTDLGRYHLILDTARWTPEEIVQALVPLTQRFRPERLGCLP